MKRIFTVLLIMCLFISLFALTNGITASAAELDEEEIENTDVIEETTENEIIASDDASIVDQEIDLNYIREPDTTVSLNLTWNDTNNLSHPLRFTRIVAYKVYFDTDILSWIRTEVFDGFTDNDGNIVFSFPNALIGNTCDLAIVVYAQGDDVSVYNEDDDLYSFTINDSSLKGLTATEHSKYLNISEILNKNATDESNLFLQALQISQYITFGSIYYEHLISNDVADVAVTYPNTDGGTHYIRSEHRIYIENHSGTLPSYAACDVIMHEYGHHVGAQEEITDSPGGWHGGSVSMAEHYKSHYLGTATSCNNKCALKNNTAEGEYKFTEAECKKKGCQIAWSEGFATFFSELAQQYFIAVYASSTEVFPTFADGWYTDYDGYNYSYDNADTIHSDSNERTVIGILYDIYDNDTTEDFDNITFDHILIWNLIKDGKATTLYEFISYLNEYHNDAYERRDFGKILEKNVLTCYDMTVVEINSFAITLRILWKESVGTTYYTARLFQVNFYDWNYNLIGSTTPEEVTMGSDFRGLITIDNELWGNILALHSSFYISITVYECDGDVNNFLNRAYYITAYESGYTFKTTYDLYGFIGNDTELTVGLTEESCDWYKFIAPVTGTFVFEISTNSYIGLELFPHLVLGKTTADILYAAYYSGGSESCRIVLDLNKNENVYIRIRGITWNQTGAYTLSICTQMHTHAYTHRYESIDAYQHKSFCICGEYIEENHHFVDFNLGERCDYCRFFIKNRPVQIQSMPSHPLDIPTADAYNEDE